ncbi:methyltransferase domain-containing protein [Aureococcus anophagefferens]|nr:methyltransferase domain-containing protein [Aureococcus anophagefferens]
MALRMWAWALVAARAAAIKHTFDFTDSFIDDHRAGSQTSTLVTVDVWPDAATAARFLKNVRASANARKVDVRRGDSALRVAELLLGGREFDFIYVDGSHRATDVLLDVSLAWRLLRSDGRGVMLLDDYARGEPAPPGPLSLDEALTSGDAMRRWVRDAGELSMTEAIDAVLSSAGRRGVFTAATFVRKRRGPDRIRHDHWPTSRDAL